MQDRKLSRILARAAALLLFFAGLYFLAQAYTMAFHGIYIDCFAPDGSGCSLRQFSDPTLTSAMYGSVLALVALTTFYLGARVLRWVGSAR